jgi:hypothetical protein
MCWCECISNKHAHDYFTVYHVRLEDSFIVFNSSYLSTFRTVTTFFDLFQSNWRKKLAVDSGAHDACQMLSPKRESAIAYLASTKFC